MIATRADLDEARKQGVCSECPEPHPIGPDEPFFFRPACHRGAHPGVNYQGGILHLSCSECGHPMFGVVVTNEEEPIATGEAPAIADPGGGV